VYALHYAWSAWGGSVNAFELVAQFLLSGLCAKKLPGLFLCNLQQFDLLKKQHFEKVFSRRIMRSAIRLFVLDFSWDGEIFAQTIR
jgi:hypothetical protein